MVCVQFRVETRSITGKDCACMFTDTTACVSCSTFMEIILCKEYLSVSTPVLADCDVLMMALCRLCVSGTA